MSSINIVNVLRTRNRKTMGCKFFLIAILAVLGNFYVSQAQIAVDQASTSAEVEALVENVLLGSCVTVSNVSYTGPASASGTFDASGTSFTMQNGILLTTGSANVAIGPDNDNDAGVNQGTVGDADLTALASESTFDGVILEFDFVPQDDSLSFRYVFASEEYPEWVNSEFNDVFGFFISGPGISGPYTGGAANIALIPGTTTPVAINNVNNGYSATEPASGPCENCAYYIDNASGGDLQYDGYTTVLTAKAVVTPCETYHIRLAIADAGDHVYDSGVFLEAGSFTSGGGITVDFSDLQIEEGCSDEYIIFRRVDLSDNSVALAATYSISGTATSGVDYSSFPTTVTIPSGEDSVIIYIDVPLDFTIEGIETIVVTMDQPPCDCLAPGHATINVIDNDIPLALTTNGETTICLGQSTSLTANTTGSLTPYSGSWNNGAPAGDNVSVSPTTTTTYTYTVTDACGSQTQTSNETVTVIRPDFVTNDLSQCFEDNSFTFSNTGATGGTVSHYWTFGDGNSSTQENPTHIYGSNGIYTVTHNVIFTATACTTNASASVTIWENPEVSATITQEISCFNAADAVITASSSNGTSPYSYLWTPGGQSSAAISSQGPNTYSVTITDANGCLASGSTIVSEPTLLTASSSNSPTSCNSICDGSVQGTASGGTPPYSYSWSGGLGAGQNHSGTACEGTYTLTVTDANGCTSTSTTTVSEPTLLTASSSNSSASCNAVCDGDVSSSASGGTPPYSYSWSGGLGAGQNHNGSVCAGSYTVTVTDANGCTTTSTTTVSEPTLLTASSTNSAASCNSVCDGSVGGGANGGTPPYSYSWSGGLGVGQNHNGNVCAGSYTLTVTDANGCTATSTTTVIEPILITASTSNSPTSCNAICDGSVEGTATGGTAPFTYSWSGGLGAGQNHIGNVCAGSYTLTVTDANGCTASSTTTVSEPTLLTASSSNSPASCNAVCDGSVEGNANGGTPPYSYAWSGGLAVGQNHTGIVCAGTYTVTVTDANGCTATSTTTVLEPTTLVATCSATDAVCNGDANGTVSVTVSGGTQAYSYSWSNGSTNSSQTGLTAGTYSVTITDENGCVANCNATISQPNALTAVVIVQDETLVNGCNGLATANPTGGTPPYTYDWSDGQTTQTAIDLCAGTYTVVISDAHGCEYTTSNIVNPPSCDLDVDVTGTDVSCNNGSDGTATATPITIQNYTPFTYLWNTGATTQTISGVSAGPYSVVVTDSIGCEASGTVVVSHPTALSVSTVVIDEQTFEGCDGSATANPTGGTPPYSYDWSDGQGTQTASDLCPGTYTVTVTDANGCEETITITVNPLLCTGFSVAINPERLSCFEAGDGSATAVVTGGTAPFTYSWSNGGTSNSISGLSAGTYTVTVVDAVNCSQTVSGNVTQPALLEAATAVDNVSCHAAANGVVELTVTGGTTPYIFDWDNGATTEDLNNVGPGFYNVLVTDENGCTTTASAVVTEPDTLQASSVDVNPTCFEGNDGSIDLTVSGGLGPYLASWSNGDNTADISGLSAGTYTATIVDQNGCIYTYSTTLSDPNLVIPTVTANGPTVFCEGDSVTLTSSEAASYEWTPGGETTQSIIVFIEGNYTVYVVSEDGCEGTSAPTNVSIFDVDSATITPDGPTEFCDGGEVILTASSGSSYSWLPNGETTQSITVATSGNYSVTVVDENGCESSSDQIDVIVNPEPEPTVTADGPLEFCENGSVTLTSSPGETYSWVPNGETTQSITVSESGVYWVTITDENGCEGRSAFTTVIVNPNPTPVITASGSLEFCEGDSVILTATESASYSWSPTNETTQSIVVYQSGTFSVDVINAEGCEGESQAVSVTIFVADSATITATGPIEFCEGKTLNLIASQGDSYLWSPTGQTTQVISANQSGPYTVTVFDENGCASASDTIVITIYDNPEPAITANGPIEFCAGDSVTLSTGIYDEYEWFLFGQTTQSIVVSNEGDYWVSVTDTNGCVGISDTISIEIFTVDSATISADGPTEFCDGDMVTLTASEGSSYAWLPNGETTQSITVSDAGTYSVTVVDANGCSSSSVEVEVIVNPNPIPIVTVNGPTEFCTGNEVLLTSSEFDSYVWSPNGETTQTISAGATGSYSVTVTDENGCMGTSSPIDVTVFDNPIPEISANGPLQFCEGDSLVLTSTLAQSYSWIPNGETTQSITVFDEGTFSVMVVDSNGCSGTSDGTVVSFFQVEPVTITADGPLTFCEGNDVVLTATTGDSYEWSPNGETSQSITVSESGTYSVTVTDANGCEDSSVSVEVTVFDTPEPTITLSGPSIFCDGDSVVLSAPTSDAYLWSPNGQTTQSITVATSGSYSVQIVDNNLCVGSSDTIEVIVHPETEIEITADGSVEFCNGGEVILMATEGLTYDWAPNGEQTQSITVSESGEYSVSVIDANGCSTSSDTIEVQAFELPEVSANLMGSDTLCEGDSVDLLAISIDPVTYQWLENGNPITGATDEILSIGNESLYTVVVTDTNGCTATADADILSIGAVPVAAITGAGWLCPGDSITLVASGGEFYLWSDGSTTATITISPDSASIYSVIVSNTACSTVSSDSTSVGYYPVPNALAGTEYAGTLANDHLFEDLSNDSSIVDWLWDFGDGTFDSEQNPEHIFDDEGFFTITLTVENEFGCTDTDTVEVEITQVIDIPNVFTPNGDGYNDQFVIKNNGVNAYELTIYNRWGIVLHYDNTGEVFWDGRTPAGAIAQAGTYYYVLKVLNEFSEGNMDLSGYITLIR